RMQLTKQKKPSESRSSFHGPSFPAFLQITCGFSQGYRAGKVNTGRLWPQQKKLVICTSNRVTPTELHRLGNSSTGLTTGRRKKEQGRCATRSRRCGCVALLCNDDTCRSAGSILPGRASLVTA